jgi:hypothetical protein
MKTVFSHFLKTMFTVQAAIGRYLPPVSAAVDSGVPMRICLMRSGQHVGIELCFMFLLVPID